MTDFIIDFQVAHFDALVEQARRELRVSCETHNAEHSGHSLARCSEALYSHWMAQTARLLRAQIVRTSGWRAAA